MTCVLRLIRQSRWDRPKECDWLAAGDIPAEPLADFANTTENRLSVWFIDDDKANLDDVLSALAANREKTDKLDYVLFAQDHLNVAGVEVVSKPGDTPDEQVNGHHRELTRLSAKQVLSLTTRVWHDNLGVTRVDQRRTLQLVASAVRSGRIALDRLSRKLCEDVRSCLEDNRDKFPKPR